VNKYILFFRVRTSHRVVCNSISFCPPPEDCGLILCSQLMARLPPCGGRPEIPPLGRLPASLTQGAAQAPCAYNLSRCRATCDPTRLLDATSLLLPNDPTCIKPSKMVTSAHLLGSFVLDNVCVRYPTRGNSVADLISGEGKCAAVFGYTEFRRAYAFISNLRPPREGEDLRTCSQRLLGLGVRYSSDNFFHQLFFAIAAHATLVDVAAPGAVFVPIGAGYPSMRPGPLWEYTLRSISNESAARLLNETQSLFESRCTCFKRFYASTHSVSHSSTSGRAMFSAFRQSSIMNARAALSMPVNLESSRSSRDMLFIMRHSARRVITNEKELRQSALAAQPRLRVLSFEEMPVAKQLSIVSEASVLIGVHGMAIAGFLVHLPTHRWRTGCVEIRPIPDKASWEWVNIVVRISNAAGVLHTYVNAAHAPGCPVDVLRSTNCTTDQCRSGVVKALRNFAVSSVLQCNVTAAVDQVLGAIQRIATLTDPSRQHQGKGRQHPPRQAHRHERGGK
jgi:hypothetical protein